MIVPGFIVDSVAGFVRAIPGMTGLKLYGSSSGSVGLQAATAAGSTNYTLPSAAPVSNGQVLSSTTAGVMSWATSGGGGMSAVVSSQLLN